MDKIYNHLFIGTLSEVHSFIDDISKIYPVPLMYTPAETENTWKIRNLYPQDYERLITAIETVIERG